MRLRGLGGSSAHILGVLRRRLPRLGRLAAMADASALTQQAIVRTLPEESTLTIDIRLAGTQRSMRRDKDEALERTLGRIRLSSQGKGRQTRAGVKVRDRTLAAATDPATPAVEVQLLVDASDSSRRPVPLDTPNGSAWLPGRVLAVGDARFAVVVNPPTVEKVIVHGQPMVGIPLCPVPTLSFAEEAACEWAWERQAGPTAWRPVPGANARVFTPGQESLGLGQLRVICTPARDTPEGRVRGAPLATELPPVKPGPPLPAGAGRHELTRAFLEPPGLRVVTYNLLADQYCSTEYAKTRLFAYCPAKRAPRCSPLPGRWRYPDYRRPLALQELLGFHADVICLQEVDEKAFAIYFRPQLEYAGYEGHYTNKAGGTAEGSATFFRADRFRLLARRDLSLRDLFRRLLEDPGAAEGSGHKQLLPFLASSPALRKHLQKVSTVAQLTALAPLSDSGADAALCVANTHLFYHPRANHIRTLHTAAIATEAASLAQAVAPECPGGRRPGLLFCGDLNSGLTKGVPGALELLASGRLPGSYWDWEASRSFRFRKDDSEEGEPPSAEPAAAESGEDESGEAAEDFRAGELSLPLRMAPADELQTLFTNFVAGFSGALDYVWYEPERMRVRREIPLPAPAELAGWIPSQRFPSDHLSVVFDLEWRQPEDSRQQLQLRDAASRRVFPAEEAFLAHGILTLQWHGVVGVPTDTLYGLAGNAADEEAIQRLYDVKRRPQGLPLAVCVAAPSDVAAYGETGHLPPGLLEQLLPGPVTLLLARKAGSGLAAALNPGVATIGIRVPDCAFMRQLCAAFGGALALTSANLSGQPSSLRVEDFRELWPRCGAVYDGGSIPEAPAGSTIVDLSQPGRYAIVRDGIALAATVGKLAAAGLRPAGAGESKA